MPPISLHELGSKYFSINSFSNFCLSIFLSSPNPSMAAVHYLTSARVKFSCFNRRPYFSIPEVVYYVLVTSVFNIWIWLNYYVYILVAVSNKCPGFFKCLRFSKSEVATFSDSAGHQKWPALSARDRRNMMEMTLRVGDTVLVDKKYKAYINRYGKDSCVTVCYLFGTC